MKIELSPSHYLRLAKKAHSLDSIYLLTLIKEDLDIGKLLKGSVKIKNIFLGLKRKALVLENGNISLKGKELLASLDTDLEELPKKDKELESPFLRWWKAYPSTDTFTHGNKTFSGSRGLRLGKQKCKDKLAKLPGGIFYTGFEQPPQCMPEEYKDSCSIKAYWNYYIGDKHRVANNNETIKTKMYER